ncbi:hypothetical protein GCM10023115_54660 [Pontixanthobacter gangjinensis]|uniref:Phage shock protein B n=1 Tax=Pontixanthobacter gangjinensis TaxID=1028742 RepID=A0A6I4SRW7_9SPHN|nr:hypothetical protein [Pontixanthobacter gangjinensis]MXO57746.1 hypothetical protein [Pontixanthobacter gangjinensis]
MNWGSPEFVIAIIAVSYGAWIINNWIRAKHGYELEDEWGGKTKPKDTGEIKQLRAENAELVGLLKDQGKRMETLERIVTDKGYRLNEEIEALRDLPDATSNNSGVPLNISKKETA